MKPYSNISLKNYLRGAWGNDATIGRYSRTDFKAAQRLFADHGYKDTSVRAVVARARVNQAAINYHFGGKDGLYREVLRATIRALTEHQLAHAEEMKGMSRENALAEFIKYQLRPLAARDELGRHFRIFNWEGSRTPHGHLPETNERRNNAVPEFRSRSDASLHADSRSTHADHGCHLARRPVHCFRAQSRTVGKSTSFAGFGRRYRRAAYNSCQRVGARRLSGRGDGTSPALMPAEVRRVSLRE